MSNCTSSHDPRSGMMRNEYSTLPLRCTLLSKQMPGERCNWLTTTRSAPLMTNVPCGVMSGISPMYTFSSLVPRSSFNWKVTCKGALKVWPFALGFERGKLRLADFVVAEIERGLVVVALDGEDFLEYCLQAAVFALARGDVLL